MAPSYPTTVCWLCNNARPFGLSVRYLLILSSLSHLLSQSRALGTFQKALLTRCSAGLYLTLAIVAWGQPPLPQGTYEQRVMWSVDNPTEVTLFATSYSPVLNRSLSLASWPEGLLPMGM